MADQDVRVGVTGQRVGGAAAAQALDIGLDLITFAGGTVVGTVTDRQGDGRGVKEVVGDVRAAAAGQHVGAGAADQAVVAVTAAEQVIALAADDRVLLRAAGQRVGAVLAVDVVAARTSVDVVIAAAAADDVVAAQAGDRVVAALAVDHVWARGARQRVIAVGARQRRRHPSAADREHVGRARIFACGGVVEPRPRHRGVARDRHRNPEQVVGGGVGGGQLLLLCPCGRRAHEHVGRPRIFAGGGVVAVRPRHHGVARDRHRDPEQVAGGGVGGGQLLLLGPRAPRAHEHVGRPRVRAGGRIVAVRPHHHGVARDRHRDPEHVVGGGVGGGQLLLLGPCAPRAHEHVGRPRRAVVAGAPTTAVSPEIATETPNVSLAAASEAVSFCCWVQVPPERTNT